MLLAVYMGEAVPPCKLPIFLAFPHVNGPPPGPKPTTDETESGVRKSCCFKAPPALLRFFGGPTANLSRFPWSGGPTIKLSRFPSLGWSCGKSLVFSLVWWSYGKSLAVSVVVRWLPVDPRRFKPAPRALLRLSGGPTANLSRFPWSGGPTVNLSRFPSLGWSCGYSLVFSGVLVVLRSISRVFRGLVVLR